MNPQNKLYSNDEERRAAVLKRYHERKHDPLYRAVRKSYRDNFASKKLPITRTCIECRQVKTAKNWYKNKTLCGMCYSFLKPNADFKTKMQLFKSTLRGRFGLLKNRAKRFHFELALSFEDYVGLVTDAKCFYCKGDLPSVGAGLDRKNTHGGYTLENVVTCCTSCNVIKNSRLTSEEMVVAMKAVLEFRAAKEQMGTSLN